jgi:alkyl sulfatase BDS1-like metallo-beta-lactamase superfamily hydrolase
MLRKKLAAFILIVAGAWTFASTAVGQDPAHFSPKGKMPSKSTIEAQEQQRKILPFSDKRDFEEAKRGFMAAPPFRQIMNDKGGFAWNIDNWDFLLKGRDYDSIHPSLQRQALLNMEYGLFEVVPGIYQVRGFDLANITFIKGQLGWIVIDPLTVKETSGAALKFVNEKLGDTTRQLSCKPTVKDLSGRNRDWRRRSWN